jgi:hypothetical protein
MKSTQLKKLFFVIILVTLVVFAILTTFIIYNYVKSARIMSCENLSGQFEAQKKILKISIMKENAQGYNLVISEKLQSGKENIIADEQGFTGDIFQIQSICINIEKLNLAQDCYINDKKISLFLRIFSPSFKDKMIDISGIGKVPPAYRREDVLYIIQKHTWKKIWSYILNPANKETVNVYNIILNLENRPRYGKQEYLIFLKQDGQMHIKYPFNTNVSPARQR